MTALESAAAALALFGHTALWIGAFSRLHALPIPRWLIGVLEKVIYLIYLAAPAAYAWGTTTAGFSLLHPAESGGFWPLWVYAAICWSVALGPGLLWLVRASRANPADVLLSNHSKLVNVARELDSPLLCGFKARCFGAIPLNEILQLEIDEKVLCLPDLPAELEGLSIVHVSDLHFTGQIAPAYFEYVVERANRLQGDLIAVTGDIVDTAACISWIPSTLGRLRAPHGVYGVLGNHDKRIGNVEPLRRTLEESGVQLLGGRWIELPIRGASLILAGDERPGFGPGPNLADAPPADQAFRVLLAHTPDRFFWAQANRFPLMLAGHNHGGQVRLPWVGPIVAPSRYGVRYAGGVYREGGTVMHVSRGVAGLHSLRYNCPPEVTKLILTRKSASAINNPSAGTR